MLPLKVIKSDSGSQRGDAGMTLGSVEHAELDVERISLFFFPLSGCARG